MYEVPYVYGWFLLDFELLPRHFQYVSWSQSKCEWELLLHWWVFMSLQGLLKWGQPDFQVLYISEPHPCALTLVSSYVLLLQLEIRTNRANLWLEDDELLQPITWVVENATLNVGLLQELGRIAKEKPTLATISFTFVLGCILQHAQVVEETQDFLNRDQKCLEEDFSGTYSRIPSIFSYHEDCWSWREYKT